MLPERIRIARDYNRGLAPPIRWAHVAWAATGSEVTAAGAWITHPRRAWWARPLFWGSLAFAILYPFDGVIMSLVQAYPPGGDIAQELKAWQQFGALGSLVFVGVLIALLDPGRVRRLADLGAAAGAVWLACQVLKLAVGRPRPDFDDPHVILGPFGAYPLGPEVGIRHAWEVWAGISSNLWSMPSSHTAAAAALTVFLTALYPRLRPVCVVLVCIVGAARVVFKDHWPSDVAVGAAAGVILARAAMRWEWGQRVVRRLAARKLGATAVRAPGRGADTLDGGSDRTRNARVPIKARSDGSRVSADPACPRPTASG